jgi:hypothetical protein
MEELNPKSKNSNEQEQLMKRLAELTGKVIDQKLSQGSTPQPTAQASHASATPTDDMQEQPEHIQELARRLFAAAISCWTPGMSLQHAYNNFAKREQGEIGSYWIELAKQVTAHHWQANS